MNAKLTVGMATLYNDKLARFVDSSTGEHFQVSASMPISVPTPGTGSVTYSLTITRTTTGNGVDGSVAWPTIQVMGFKA
jgi:hypothetical protein